MYLHIGKDIILKKEKIIGIFNIESILDTKEYQTMIEVLESGKRIQDISKRRTKNSYTI